jgi:hypothetical protein
MAPIIPRASTPPAPSPANAAPVDKELHENVVKLIELMGVRQRILDTRERTVQAGKRQILHQFPSYNPAFADEWAKRMAARMNADDYVDVMVAVYEKHYNNDDVLELIQAQRDSAPPRIPNISQPLKDKVAANATAMQSEMMTGFAQVGERLGGAIGAEVGKEHPEWVTPPPMKMPSVPDNSAPKN